MKEMKKNDPVTRSSLKSMKRVLIKIGTSVVINTDGRVALGRLGNLVEQIVKLHRADKQVILVSSGAIGVGNLKIQQSLLKTIPLKNHIDGTVSIDTQSNSVCAATGQSGLMALYEMLFGHKQVTCSQILLTEMDLHSKEKRKNLRETISTLLSLGIVPIVNENDVLGPQRANPHDKALFWDNDSLACLLSKELDVELMIILSDVDGIYKRIPEGNQKPEIIHTFIPGVTEVKLGDKSKFGRGGMQSKLESAITALDHVRAVVIANGYKLNTISQIAEGNVVGTLLASNIRIEEDKMTILAKNAKLASRSLQHLSGKQRSSLIFSLAENIKARQADILEANSIDLKIAEIQKISTPLLSRLKLTPQKINTIVTGLIQLSKSEDPIGKTLHKVELAPNLILSKETVPLGLLLVIFESRPDVLPQVVGLALKSGNGLILKGGKEALNTNKMLHSIVIETIEKVCRGHVPKNVIELIETRDDVDKLLGFDNYIDLVIPRGSSDLVRYIQTVSKIPVLGHSEGICHVYIDENAPFELAIPITIDSKTDYPSACNAVETILIHEKWPRKNVLLLLDSLKTANVDVFGGPNASKQFNLPPAEGFNVEYGDLSVTLEIVPTIDDAIHHINTFGSGHTDSIITKDKSSEKLFMKLVDSACVFVNSSTRFSDGFRFGLGAEVGISTSKIHARGPVGIEGLLSTKWKLFSSEEEGSVVSEFSNGRKHYTHRMLSKL